MDRNNRNRNRPPQQSGQPPAPGSNRRPYNEDNQGRPTGPDGRPQYFDQNPQGNPPNRPFNADQGGGGGYNRPSYRGRQQYSGQYPRGGNTSNRDYNTDQGRGRAAHDDRQQYFGQYPRENYPNRGYNTDQGRGRGARDDRPQYFGQNQGGNAYNPRPPPPQTQPGRGRSSGSPARPDARQQFRQPPPGDDYTGGYGSVGATVTPPRPIVSLPSDNAWSRPLNTLFLGGPAAQVSGGSGDTGRRTHAINELPPEHRSYNRQPTQVYGGSGVTAPTPPPGGRITEIRSVQPRTGDSEAPTVKEHGSTSYGSGEAPTVKEHGSTSYRSGEAPTVKEHGSTSYRSGEGSSSRADETAAAGVAAASDQLRKMTVTDGDVLTPMRRPPPERTPPGKRIEICVNHFPVRFDEKKIVTHYHLVVKPDDHIKAVTARIASEIFKKQEFATYAQSIAYDGDKSVYSSKEIELEQLIKVNFKKEGVEVDFEGGPFHLLLEEDPKEEEEGKKKIRHTEFLVYFRNVGKLEYSAVPAYLRRLQNALPRDTLQAMDLIARENLRRERMCRSRLFFSKTSPPLRDIGWGVIVHVGIQQSLKLTQQGLVLCLDYSVVPFYKAQNVLRYLTQKIRNFNRYGRRYLPEEQQREVKDTMKGLKVSLTYRDQDTKQIVREVTEGAAGDLSFTVSEPGKASQQVNLLDYFYDKYEIDLQNPHLPCLNVGKSNKDSYVPLELCQLLPWQLYRKDSAPGSQVETEWKKLAVVTPLERMNRILALLNAADGPQSAFIQGEFGIRFDNAMTRVSDARVLERPVIRVGRSEGGNSMGVHTRDNGVWSFGQESRLLEPVNIHSWGIVDFLADDRISRLYDDGEGGPGFISLLVARAQSLGIDLDPHPLVQEARTADLSSATTITKFLTDMRQKTDGKLQIVVCVMANRHSGYKTIKRVSEINEGIMTQCCLRKPKMRNPKIRDQYYANLLLKINAKVGGQNMALLNDLPGLPFPATKGVMFIGADVNHPRNFDANSHSIAAVTGSINWPAANRYVARFRIQSSRTEPIGVLGQMCLELVDAYAQANNGRRPEKIFLFRDGVSDSQFHDVLNTELAAVKKSICTKGYSPTITLIVAQKRHQTRLFIPRRDDNVPAGTVVDTTIVDSRDFDFYLCSHQGLLGTSKPTHYYVLKDENNLASSQLQQILYNLCYTFARCTKPISLVPPVYYADLVAYRARFYYDQYIEIQNRNNRYYVRESDAFLNERLRLHFNVRNTMFFC